MNKKILEMAAQHKEDSFFTYDDFNNETRQRAEDALNVHLPEQYVEYLKMFGHGGVAGVEILGVCQSGSLAFVDSTQLYRRHGLPENLVIIENQDEWMTCIDCATGKIVSWSQDGSVLPEYDCFDDCIVDEFQEAIDNL